MKLSQYQANGFYLLNPNFNGLISYKAAAVNIVKGDYLIFTAGYATNTATAFQLLLVCGIAAENCDNSAGAVGDKSVLVIPLLEQLQFSVPVASDALITQANVGVGYDLEANDDIDISDTTLVAGSKVFIVDDFDASAEAIDGNTYGYAIGHFKQVTVA
jgi:hypothetical protein